MRSLPLTFALAGVLSLTAVVGCGGGGGTTPDPDSEPTNPDPNDPNDPDPNNPSTPFPRQDACQDKSVESSLVKKPVDIIFVIDNSGSMTEEIVAVQNNINSNFAQIIADSGLDYQIIMVSKHGSASSAQSICISSPLSGGSCSTIPAQPAMTTTFKHYSVEIGSLNSFERLIATYDTKVDGSSADDNNNPTGGWSTWLRADASKTFVVVTDDDSEADPKTAEAFENALFAKGASQFWINGDRSKRNFVWHSIIGLKSKTDLTAAYAPTENLVADTCDTAADPGPTGSYGTEYQVLSRTTGGVRFPVCNTKNYDAVFNAVAQGVIAGSKVSCEFQPPAPPNGQAYSQSFVEYLPNGTGTAQIWTPVAPGACGTADGYTVDDETQKITLCPSSCTKVTDDDTAKVSFVFKCEPVFN